MYDIVIIGCGVVGAAVAYELSKYNVSIAVLEKENDIADGTTKANSAIIHAGYDSEEKTLMAKLNVEGSKMIEEIAKKLSVHYKKCGSLVVAFSHKDIKTLNILYERGNFNGVAGLKLLTEEETKKMEPNLSDEVKGALYAPSAAIINPWELCIAMAETAKKNGTDFFLNSPAEKIEKTENGYRITTANRTIESKYIVNAAGLHADNVHNLVAKPEFIIKPNKGEYYLMDKNQGTLVNTVIFQCPNENGKGVLVAPTVHGNLIVGPNSLYVDSSDVSTTSEGLEFVKNTALNSIPSIDFKSSIRNFAGLRAYSDCDDFIIRESKYAKGFIDIAGIKSPGLSSSPAIAKECIHILESIGLILKEKKNYCDERNIVCFKDASMEEKKNLIKNNPLYGRVICRCETITEGEIVDALHSPLPPCTLDGIKKRCNAGMGRCQGGFCGPRVQEIISCELKIPIEEVLLNKRGTVILMGETKKEGILNEK